MRAALAVIGVIIILVLFGSMMAGIKSAQTDERDDAFNAVTTGPGVTTADVVLVTDIYDNDILNVSSIVSDNIADAPLANAYTPASNTLEIRGLADTDTRNLIVTYAYGTLTGAASSTSSFLNMIPIFIAISAVVIIVGAGIFVFAHKGGS
jgi:hypothetical protein